MQQCFSDAGWSSLVARRAHNPKVVGSNPAPATNNSPTGFVTEKHYKSTHYTLCSSVISDAGWSSLVARRAHNPKVVGSNPAPATNLSNFRDFDLYKVPFIGIFFAENYIFISDLQCRLQLALIISIVSIEPIMFNQ